MYADISNQINLHFDIQIKHNHIEVVRSLKNIPNICNESNHKRIRIPCLYLSGHIYRVIRAHSTWKKEIIQSKTFSILSAKINKRPHTEIPAGQISVVLLCLNNNSWQIWHCLYILSICSHGHQGNKPSGRLNNLSLALKQEIQNNVRTVFSCWLERYFQHLKITTSDHLIRILHFKKFSQLENKPKKTNKDCAMS